MRKVSLNEEQKLAVLHEEGVPAVLIAGAGSGKTAVMTERVREIIQRGEDPRKILVVTFTNKAANELIERLGIKEDEPHPRVGTIHSLALALIRRDPKGFGLAERITTLDEYDQKVLIQTVIDHLHFDTIKPYNLLPKLQYHRARGIGFRKDYTSEVHSQAQKAYSGQHLLTDEELQVWERYEKEKARQGLIDFDDMIHLVVRRGETDEKWVGKVKKQFNHILMDEAQDTNTVQWRFINMLFREDNHNAFVVGDLSQCQPPETRVTVLDPDTKGKGRGTLPIKEVQLGSLKDGDSVLSWTPRDYATYRVPRKIVVASRPYVGKMLTLHCENGNKTRMTPNHWVWVRYTKNVLGKHIVYLMYKEGIGFRVGSTCIKNPNGMYGLTGRVRSEKADRAWILRVVDTREESLLLEELISLEYGIPERLFSAAGCLSNEQHLRVFKESPSRWETCLKDHGRLFDFPLVKNWEGGDSIRWKESNRTAACNVLPGLMEIPQMGRNKYSNIISVTEEDYDGSVFSLDVEKDHTYIADGVVVGNSIYGFAGASPETLHEFTRGWRGVVPKMYKIARNHRSVPEVVALANRIQRTMTETIPLKMESWRGLNGDHGVTGMMTTVDQRSLAQNIAASIHQDRKKYSLSNVAILVRSGGQVKDLEPELVKLKIPYIIRGAQGFLQTEEVRDILAYLRVAVNPRDYPAFKRSCTTPKRGFGESSLEILRKYAEAEHDGDLVKAATTQGKLMLYLNLIGHLQSHKDNPLECLEQAIKRSGYEKYLETKYKGDKDKIEIKLSNLNRLRETFETLSSETEMSLDDIIFQLVMNGDKEESEEGRVVISTIHSSKGLEWPKVFLYGVYEGQMPHKFSQTEKEVEEERRLFYVACTRAKDHLVLGIPASVVTNYNTTFVAPSRFLFEIGLLKKEQ